jgi:hypothetical protein
MMICFHKPDVRFDQVGAIRQKNGSIIFEFFIIRTYLFQIPRETISKTGMICNAEICLHKTAFGMLWLDTALDAFRYPISSGTSRNIALTPPSINNGPGIEEAYES